MNEQTARDRLIAAAEAQVQHPHSSAIVVRYRLANASRSVLPVGFEASI